MVYTSKVPYRPDPTARGWTRRPAVFSCLWLLLVCGSLLGAAPHFLLPQAAEASEDAEVEHVKGVLAYDQRNYLDALDHFRKAVELQPEYADAQFYLGLSLTRIGEFTDAIAALEKARQLDPSIERLHYHLGLAYFQAERFQEALESFKRAEQDTPDDAPTQFYLGFTHFKLQQYDQAVPLLDRAAELDPTLTLSAQYYRGVALYNLERDTQARQALKASITTEPDSLLAQSAQRYLTAIANRAHQQRLVQLQGVMGYQYDDNVTLADDSIISREGDSRALFVATVRLVPVRTRVFRLGAEYDLFQSLHGDLTEFDIQSHTARLFTQFKLSRVTLQVAADYNYKTLGGPRYSEAITVESSLLVRETDRLYVVISARYRLSDYLNQFIITGQEEVRDRDGYSVLTGFDQYFSLNRNRTVIRLSYHFEASRNNGSDWEYNAHRFGVGVQQILVPMLTLNLDVTYLRRDYLHVNSFDTPDAVLDMLDTQKRQDDRYTVSVALAWEPVRYVILSFGFRHTANVSSIDFFDYDRNIFTLAVTGRY